MPRVAVIGFQHETNSFAPTVARWDDFVEPDAWPGLLLGDDMFSGLAGSNIPAAGFMEAARSFGWDVVPVLWCSASPSGPVTADAYERITRLILERLRDAAPVDAVYLDLHGAMIAECEDDADGALLEALRAGLGAAVPIVASLDLHANVSARMVACTDALVMYRAYPHVDMAETGARAAARLEDLLGGQQLHAIMTQADFLIPLLAQCTSDPAMVDVMAELSRLRGESDCEIEFAPGFPLSDVRDCGPAVVVYGPSPEVASDVAARALSIVAAHEGAFQIACLEPDYAIARAQETIQADAKGPVLLIDTQDNPGCGGSGASVGLLAALKRAMVKDAVFGVLYDAVAAQAAHAAGVGATVNVTLGKRQGADDHDPEPDNYRVMALGDGRFDGTGPFYKGCRFDLGPMALLEVAGVRVVVASRSQQAADRAMFRHLGLEPEDCRILALKSSIHYRADFESIAAASHIVACPGYNVADPRALAYAKQRPGIRVAGDAS